jgi:hypothetical protein
MAVVAICSVRSCAVTTLACGLAMAWPGEGRRLLVEADPAGGTLCALAGLAPEPGLVSLAAAGRRGTEPSLAFEHAQLLPGATPVVCAPPGAVRARQALSMLAGLFGRLGELDAEVLIDCGRLDQAPTSALVFEQADLAMVACRPRLSDLSALRAFFDERAEGSRPVLVVLVGDGPYRAKEVEEALGVSVAGQLPFDPEAAAAIGTMAVSSRRLTRTPLVRAMRTLAETLAGRLTHAASDRPVSSSMAASGNGRVISEGPL